MFAGPVMTIGEKKYTVPPVTLGQLRNGVLKKLQEHDELVANGKPYEAMSLRAEVILAALQRNYPDLTAEELDTQLDVANINSIWNAVLGLSGFSPSGEAQAATANGSGT